jgi:hypothetical protein
MGTDELSTYMTRLRIRLNRANIPERYFMERGHPWINTPKGRILRPSLGHAFHGTGV